MILIVCFRYLNIIPIPWHHVSMGLLREDQQSLTASEQNNEFIQRTNIM